MGARTYLCAEDAAARLGLSTVDVHRALFLGWLKGFWAEDAAGRPVPRIDSGSVWRLAEVRAKARAVCDGTDADRCRFTLLQHTAAMTPGGSR